MILEKMFGRSYLPCLKNESRLDLEVIRRFSSFAAVATMEVC